MINTIPAKQINSGLAGTLTLGIDNNYLRVNALIIDLLILVVIGLVVLTA